MIKNDIDNFDKIAVRFTADWCGPCKQFAPTFDSVSNEFPELSVGTVNVGPEEGQALAQAYGILGIPAVIFLKKGQVIQLMAGNQPTEEVTKAFQKLKDA